MSTASVATRVRALPWTAIGESLSNDGYALTEPVLSRSECDQVVESYGEKQLFRSQIVMSRFGFGRGEYKYFGYPLPVIVSEIREHAYPPLAQIASQWAHEMGVDPFPETHNEFLKTCEAGGQIKPTPLLLRYEAGDFNCLHQDLYGAVAFPLQMTFFLSQKGRDYEGGEFVLVEQRPRMQSRVRVISAEQGCAVIFPTRYRLVQGTRGVYRANLKHGVSPLRSGSRFALGIIFHDAE